MWLRWKLFGVIKMFNVEKVLEMGFGMGRVWVRKGLG